MKKFYVLTTLFLSLFTLAQGLENFDNSNATSSYSDNSFVGNGGVTWTYVQSRDQNNDANGSGIAGNALMLRRASSNSKITSSSIANGIGDFSVKLYKGFTGAGDRQVELFVNGVSYGTSAVFDDYSEHVFTVTGINISGNVVIEIANTTEKQVIIDDITWTATSTDPSISITSPAEGAVLPLGTTEYSFSFVTSNFTVPTDGHVHVTLDGANAGNYMYFTPDPIALTGLTPGTHTLKMQLVDTNHAALSPDVFDEVTFTIPEPLAVADLATLRADVVANGVGGYYTITGEVVVSYVVEDAGNGAGGRNQRYVQDATGGLLLDDTAGVLAEVEGDGITGLLIKAGAYGGVLQGVPQADPTASSTANTLIPETITLASYLANPEVYESKLILLEGMTFADAGATFAADTNYSITDGTDTTVLRTAFDMSDIIGTVVPAPSNVTCLGSEFNGTIQVLPRRLSDIQVMGVEDVNTLENSVTLSNTLVKDSFSVMLEGKANVEIYNMNGQLVKTANGTDLITISANGLTQGVYLVKVSQDGQFVSKQIIKQ